MTVTDPAPLIRAALKARRDRMEMHTVRWLAYATQIPEIRLYDLMRGNVTWVRSDAEKVAAALGVPFDQVFPATVPLQDRKYDALRRRKGGPRALAPTLAIKQKRAVTSLQESVTAR